MAVSVPSRRAPIRMRWSVAGPIAGVHLLLGPRQGQAHRRVRLTRERDREAAVIAEASTSSRSRRPCRRRRPAPSRAAGRTLSQARAAPRSCTGSTYGQSVRPAANRRRGRAAPCSSASAPACGIRPRQRRPRARSLARRRRGAPEPGPRTLPSRGRPACATSLSDRISGRGRGVIDLGRFRPPRLVHIDDERQRLVVDADEAKRFLGRGHRGRRDRDDRLADIANHGIRRIVEADGANDRAHARIALGGAGIDGAHLRRGRGANARCARTAGPAARRRPYSGSRL